MSFNHCKVVYLLPVGNSNEGSSLLFTGLLGLFEGVQIFSNPVTSWTVPFPALQGEDRTLISEKIQIILEKKEKKTFK